MKGKQPGKSWTEPDSTDDLITELEFTETLSRLSKDTLLGPDKVKYSDIENLLIYNKSDLFRLYEESFATGQVPEDWSHSCLKPIPKPGKDHIKLNGYRTLTMQNTTAKLIEWIVVRKLVQEKYTYLSAKIQSPKSIQARRKPCGAHLTTKQ